MNTTLRVLAAALLALWFAIPGVSGDGEGGENAGGTGVWILPRCESISSGTWQIGQQSQPRVAPFAIPSLNQNVKLRVSNECGATSATLFDGENGTPITLGVVGQYVELPSSLLRGLHAAGVAESQIIVADANGRGYLIELRIDIAAATAEVRVY
jgi:hypothetical protein